MHTTFKFQVLYIDAIVTRAPGVERRRVFAIGIVFLDFRLRGAIELVTVILQESVDLAIIQHIVLGSVRMEMGIGRCALDAPYTFVPEQGAIAAILSAILLIAWYENMPPIENPER